VEGQAAGLHLVDPPDIERWPVEVRDYAVGVPLTDGVLGGLWPWPARGTFLGGHITLRLKLRCLISHLSPIAE
jgi:hypothetical protein